MLKSGLVRFLTEKAAPRTGPPVQTPSCCWGKTRILMYLGSGPLLHMACMSPTRFNYFLCKIIQRNYCTKKLLLSQGCQLWGVADIPPEHKFSCIIFDFTNSTITHANWIALGRKYKNNATHPPTYFDLPHLIKLLHTPLGSVFSLCTSTNFWKTTYQNLPHFHS